MAASEFALVVPLAVIGVSVGYLGLLARSPWMPASPRAWRAWYRLRRWLR